MNSPEIKAFIQENSCLFWWIKPEEKENISVDFLVESILNYGNEKNVRRLFELVGIQKVAEDFLSSNLPATGKLPPSYHSLFQALFSTSCIGIS